jgi:thiol reductant ABC exporter CydC subunit
MTPRWRELVRLAVPEWPRLVGASLLAATTIAASLALMGSSAWLITTAAFHPSIAVLQVAIVGVRAFGLSRGAARYADRLLTHDVTLRLLVRLRLEVFQRLARPPIGPRQAVATGDALSRVMGDLDTLEHAYTRIGGPVAAALVAGAGLTAVMALIHPPAALVLVLGLTLGGLVAPGLIWKQSRWWHQVVFRQRAYLQVLAVDGLQGAADLLAFGADARFARTVAEATDTLARHERRLARLATAGPAATALATDLTTIGVAATGAAAVAAGTLAPVPFAVLVLLAAASGEIIALLPAAWQALSSTEAAAARVWPADDVPAGPVRIDPNPAGTRLAPPQSAPHDATPDAASGGLRVRGLTFTYPGAPTPSLSDVSLDLPHGRLVAVVGDSGAGKSTLAQVLLRFWPVASDAIWLEGRPLADWPEGALRRQVSWMGQRAHILTGTLHENLTLSAPDATVDAVWAALDAVGLGEAVRRWPRGLDTWIGELGTTLSGGERQRLALARVLLADSAVVLLDEPTSQVDADTERVMLMTMRELARTRAVLLITHRLAMLDVADEVVVLEGGRVVERGELAVLSARPGGALRARLAREQGEDAPLTPER